MTRLTLTVAAFLFPSIVLADEITIFSVTNEQGRKREYRISEETAARLPAWVPGSAKQLPLSPSAATVIAKKNVKTADQADIVASSICLQLAGEDHGGIWFYVVNLYDRTGGPGGSNPALGETVVLLDGTIVIAKVSGNEVATTRTRPRSPCHGARYVSEVGDKRYTTCVPTDLLKAAPRWDPTTTPAPPLAAGTATKAAQAVVHELFPSETGWHLNSVSLHSSSDNRWYYIVSYLRSDRFSQFGFRIPGIDIPVLMNGTTVKPTLETAP